MTLTDQYRSALVALRGRAAARAAAAWGAASADDIDASFAAATAALVPRLAVLQATAVRASNVYARAYVASEVGRPRRTVAAPAERWVGGSRVQDKSLTDAFAGVAIGAKVLIRDGAPAPEAVRRAGAQVARIAGEEVVFAARDSLTEVVREDNQIAGYRRVASGSACAACLAAMTGAVLAEEPLDVHDHCSCVGEPVVRSVRETIQRPTGEEIVAGMSPERMAEQFGPQAAQALQDGSIELRDLVGRVEHAAMADGLPTPASIYNLRMMDQARQRGIPLTYEELATARSGGDA